MLEKKDKNKDLYDENFENVNKRQSTWVSSKHQFSNFHLSWQICKSKMSQLMENDLTKQINFSNLCNIHDLHISQDRWKLK